jgi:hypothetical protein
MPAGRGEPPPAGEMLLPPRPPERAGSHGILEPKIPACHQRKTAVPAGPVEIQLNTEVPSPGQHSSSQSRQPRPKTR